MCCSTLSFIVGAGIFGNVATAQTLHLVCENWHPRLGQMNHLSFAVDVARQTCNGNPCKITDGELSWTEQGGRYEHVINQPSDGRRTGSPLWRRGAYVHPEELPGQ